MTAIRWRRRPALAQSELRTDLERELVRARRYQRPFSMVLLCRAEAPTRHEGLLTLARTPDDLSVDGEGLVLRSGDSGWTDGQHLVVVLPEAGLVHAEAAVERIGLRLAPAGWAGPKSVVTFPDDGLTARALLEKLVTDTSTSNEPAPTPLHANGQAANGNGRGAPAPGNGAQPDVDPMRPVPAGFRSRQAG